MDVASSLTDVASAPEPAPARAPALPASIILLVEDDRLSQRLVSMILTQAGHEVLLADSVAQGLELLRKNPLVDLAVVDNQLGLEKGWSLVAEVRRLSYLSDLSVITYTESRDRDVVRRYLELGVQGFHLKPYKAETLFAELERAHAKGRRQRLIEPPETACARLNVSREQYAGLLNTGAGAVEQCCLTIRRLLLSSGDARVAIAFRSMMQQLRQLGVHIVDKLGAQAEDELRRGEYNACTDTLAIIDSVAVFLRRRALDYLALGDSVVSGLPGGTMAPFGRREGGAGSTPASGPALPAAPHVKAILARPVGSLGTQALRRGLAAPFAGGELSEAGLKWMEHPTVAAWVEAIKWLDGAETLAQGEVVTALEAVPGYEPTIEAVLNRIGVHAFNHAGRVDWLLAVKKLGVVKAAVLASAGRLGRAGFSSPLPLAPLRQHALTLLLLGFEFARLLRLTLPQKVAAAALARNLGLWTIAVNDPLLTAFALARAQHSATALSAEEEVLGIGFGAAGAGWLKAAGVGTDELYQDAARGGSTFVASEVTVAVLAVVEQLGLAALLADPVSLNAVAEPLREPGHALWETLRRRGVELPGEPAELVELALPMAKSAAWIAEEITQPRNAV